VLNTKELRPAISEYFIIQDALTFFSKQQNPHPSVEPIYRDYANDVNTLKGTQLSLGKVQEIHSGSQVIEMGAARFDGLQRSESGWTTNFTLLPEGISVQLNVDQAIVKPLT
jgi:hypothetical protein